MLVPSRTAFVVIDMVPFFVEGLSYGPGVVPVINRLAETMRRCGGTVAWVVPDETAPSSARLEFLGPIVAESYRTSGGVGTPAERLWDGLDHHTEDVAVEKSTASAFFPGSCGLDETLRARQIDTVVIAGAVANVCVESTARDAATLGYRVVMAADAIVATRDTDLNATLHTIYRSFGDVRSAEDVEALLAH